MDAAICKILQTKNWQHLGLLGKGSFGVVVSVKDTCGQRILAVKFSTEENGLESEIWPSLLHPNIAPLYEIIKVTDIDGNAFVMPKYKISLANYLRSQSLVRKEDALKTICRWLHEVLCGVRYLHRRQLSHLDLKLDNILLTEKDKAIISDFTHITDATVVTSEHFMGMPNYWKPPELWHSSNKKHVAQMLDIWCYGLIVLESVTRFSLYRFLKGKPSAFTDPSSYITHYLNAIENERNYLESEIQKSFLLTDMDHSIEAIKQFMRLFLEVNPEERISAEEAFKYILDICTSF